MNNSMYYLKPTCPMDGPPISYPSCMYTLPDPQGNTPETEISMRQDCLIEKLSSLLTSADQLAKRKGISITGDVSVPSHTGLVNGLSATNSHSKVCINIAVHADPRKPPFSLFLILRLMREKGFLISVTCHIHSTLTNVRESVLRLNKFAEQISTPEVSKSHYDYIVNLIWKEQPLFGECQAISNNFKRHPLIGEIILARALWREPLSMEELAILDQIDHELLLGTKKEQMLLLNKINSEINSVRNKSPLVAILLLSGLHQHGLSLKCLPQSINSWINEFSGKYPYLTQILS